MQRLLDHGYAVDHGTDHGGTVSVYLDDPDGNGVELYYDRPRADWFDADGRPVLKADRFDPATSSPPRPPQEPEPMYAQLIEGGTTPDRRSDMDRIVTDEMIPALKAEPGFAGALNLVDRDSGDAMMIVLWETEAQARRALAEYGARVPEGARRRRRDLDRHAPADLGLGSQRARLILSHPKPGRLPMPSIPRPARPASTTKDSVTPHPGRRALALFALVLAAVALAGATPPRRPRTAREAAARRARRRHDRRQPSCPGGVCPRARPAASSAARRSAPATTAAR